MNDGFFQYFVWGWRGGMTRAGDAARRLGRMATCFGCRATLPQESSPPLVYSVSSYLRATPSASLKRL